MSIGQFICHLSCRNHLHNIQLTWQTNAQHKYHKSCLFSAMGKIYVKIGTISNDIFVEFGKYYEKSVNVIFTEFWKYWENLLWIYKKIFCLKCQYSVWYTRILNDTLHNTGMDWKIDRKKRIIKFRGTESFITYILLWLMLYSSKGICPLCPPLATPLLLSICYFFYRYNIILYMSAEVVYNYHYVLLFLLLLL